MIHRVSMMNIFIDQASLVFHNTMTNMFLEHRCLTTSMNFNIIRPADDLILKRDAETRLGTQDSTWQKFYIFVFSLTSNTRISP